MSDLITTKTFEATGLIAGLYKAIGVNVKDIPKIYDRVFKTEVTNRAYDEYVMISGMALAKKVDQGSQVQFDSMKEVWNHRLEATKYGTAMQITMEALRDQQASSPLMAKKAESFAKAMLHKRETVGSDIHNNGFNSSFAGGDGVELYSTAHPIDSGTFSNKCASAADLSESTLEQAVIDIRNFTDQRGLKMRANPTKLYIPVDSVFDAHRILNSVARVGTPDNDMNALKHLGLLREIVESEYITDTDSWSVLTDAPDGLCHITRQEIEMSEDEDFLTKNMRFMGLERYVFGWKDPRGAHGS
jgi:hypothetical protein